MSVLTSYLTVIEQEECIPVKLAKQLGWDAVLEALPEVSKINIKDIELYVYKPEENTIRKILSKLYNKQAHLIKVTSINARLLSTRILEYIPELQTDHVVGLVEIAQGLFKTTTLAYTDASLTLRIYSSKRSDGRRRSPRYIIMQGIPRRYFNNTRNVYIVRNKKATYLLFEDALDTNSSHNLF